MVLHDDHGARPGREGGAERVPCAVGARAGEHLAEQPLQVELRKILLRGEHRPFEWIVRPFFRDEPLFDQRCVGGVYLVSKEILNARLHFAPLRSPPLVVKGASRGFFA